jgi:uncharacterized protein DUF1259
MRITIMAARPAAVLVAILATAGSGAAQEPGKAWAAVDSALGRTGTSQPGDVQKYSFPRSDLKVTVGDVTVKPALALGSWVAFKPTTGHDVIAMGDLVLLEREVGPVIGKLQAMGVEQTALHNHLQHESPRIMYLHIHAHGDRMKVAQAIRAALASTKTPSAAPTASAVAPFELDTAKLASALGYAGKVNGGVYQVSVPRAEPVRIDGTEIPPSMGVATALNFQPTGNGKAAITGDFVLTADEVNPVIRALRDGGVAVTALHSHMLTEEPPLFFMHFWANDEALALARTLHAALGHVKIRPRAP